MNFLPTALTELPFSKQKQNLINQFINPFYADYKQSQQVSLNEKDLEKLFKQQLRMSDYLEGTPKAQLRQLFQTKRQQDKIQDVLKKASIRTLRHLKKGVELFDKILLNFILDRLKFLQWKSYYQWKQMNPNWNPVSSTEQNEKLEFLIHNFTDQFLDENERQREKIELKKVIYKIHLLLTKLIRPYFLANEWLNHNFSGNDLIGNYGRFNLQTIDWDLTYDDWIKYYIQELVDYFLPTDQHQPLDNDFQSYLERIREGISSGNSNKVFSMIMRNIKDKYRAWIIRVNNSIAENQRNEGRAIYSHNILDIPRNRGNREDNNETAVGSNMNDSEIRQTIRRTLPPPRPRLTFDEMLNYDHYWGETARVNNIQDMENADNTWNMAGQQVSPTDLQSPLARGIQRYGLFAMPP